MFKGIEHVGIGVSDMETALRFYSNTLGFSEVLFDYTGKLPGLEWLGNDCPKEARIVILSNPASTPIGPGKIKLVQVLDPPEFRPLPEGQAWGELGVCEICIHVRGIYEVYNMLVNEQGCQSLMEPVEAALTPYNVEVVVAYISDPWGGKIELIEWRGLWKSLPGEPRIEGINHVAFGVNNLNRSREFFRSLGFKELVFESDGFFDPMEPWYKGKRPDKQLMFMVMPAQGASIEPVQLVPETRDCRGVWGHMGPMEYAVGVTNIDHLYATLKNTGFTFKSEPVSIKSNGRELNYVYFKDPDDLYACFVEARI